MNLNVKSILKNSFVNHHRDILLTIILLEIKVLLYGRQIAPEYFNPFYMCLPVTASLLPIISLSLLFKNGGRIRYLYILDLVISVILIADLVYFRYFKDIISVAAIRDSVLLGDVTSSVRTLIKPIDFINVFDLIFLYPVLKKLKDVPLKRVNLKSRLAAFLIPFMLGAGTDYIFVHQLSIEQPMLITTMSNKIYLTKVLGNINFHALDIYNFMNMTISKNKKLPDDQKEAIATFLSNHTTASGNTLHGEGAEKNLIVLQVEALQQFVINAEINGQAITPNLNRWIKRSLYFNNYFYQVAGGNTSDAEFLSNNSLYPAASGAAYYKYTGNTLNSLPKVLKEQGYYSAALHGYIEGFWNRNVMYKTEGFDNFFGEHSFTIDDKVGLGLSDKSFLTQSLEKLKTFKEPYYAFLVTLSSHFPYDDVKGYGTFDVGKYEGTFLGNYLKGIHYADAQLGMFLDKLEQEGIMDKSIIVLYGDHFAIPKQYADQLYDFEGISEPSDLKWVQMQKVPMFIHFPGDSHHGVNSTYGGQIDLYPTLSNLFSFSNKNTLGKDLLNTSGQDLVFRDGSFTDGKIFYIASTNTYYNLSSGEKIIESTSLQERKQHALQTLSYSDNLLDYDLLKEP